VHWWHKRRLLLPKNTQGASKLIVAIDVAYNVQRQSYQDEMISLTQATLMPQHTD